MTRGAALGFARLRPITARALGRIRPRGLEAVANKIVELDRGRHWSARPLLYPAGETERITGHHQDADPQANLALIQCQDAWQGPTRAYLLENVLIADGTLMGASWTFSLKKQKRRLIISGSIDVFDEAAVSSTSATEKYFGHWLRDQLTTELLISDWGLPAIALPGTVRASEAGYRNAADLIAHQPAAAMVERLWVFDDFEITDHRVSRLERLRSRIRGSAHQSSPELIFLSRGEAAKGRLLVNEREIALRLKRLGFKTIYPDRMPVPDLIDALSGARVVVGPEGSAFANALMCAPEGVILIQIQSPKNFNLHYRLYCEALNMTLGFIVGEEVSSEGYRLDPIRLESFLSNEVMPKSSALPQ